MYQNEDISYSEAGYWKDGWKEWQQYFKDYERLSIQQSIQFMPFQ